MTVNVVAELLFGMVIVPETLPPAPPAAPDTPPPPPPPLMVKVNEVTPADTVRVWVPAVLRVTEEVVVPWNEVLALLVHELPATALTL